MAVQVAIMLVVILGFAALTVDTGLMFNAKGQLQRTADAAALAAASRLAAYEEGDPVTLARQAALEFAGMNEVLNKRMGLTADDVQFGRAVWDRTAHRYDFSLTEDAPNAVRVVVRQTEGSPNGPLPLLFAKVFGRKTTNVFAQATAILVPRDIAVVADLSASHSDDSELKNYRGTEINLFEVWDGLPGGIDDPDGSTWTGNEFAVDASGYSPQMAGPGWGNMKALGYGTETLDSSYDPAADPGLAWLPYDQNWNNAAIRNALANQGYTSAEVNAIMTASNDSSNYAFRVATALGLARWNSGMAGGLWQQMGLPASAAGNGNAAVSGTELTWTETVLSRSQAESTEIWRDYIDNYMRSTSNEMYRANSAFRYRFGMKTLINYVLDRRVANALTPELASAPHQPMQAVKDAVGALTATLVELNSKDHVSLEIYGTTARHEVNLTGNVIQVSNRLGEMQAGHYDSWTNIGGGILRGIEELHSGRHRPIAERVMFLLTDGVANVPCETCGGGNPSGGRAYALQMAQEAVSKGIQIFTISVGSVSDRALMDEIATMGNGQHFHAEGSIDHYEAQLDAIFQYLGGRRNVRLIE